MVSCCLWISSLPASVYWLAGVSYLIVYAGLGGLVAGLGFVCCVWSDTWRCGFGWFVGGIACCWFMWFMVACLWVVRLAFGFACGCD